MNTVPNLYSLLMVINLFLAVTIIFLERRNASATWAWLMVLFFLPALGFLLYLMLGQSLSKRRYRKLVMETEKVLDSLIEDQRARMQSGDIRFADPAMAEYRDMIYLNMASDQALYTQNNRIEVFTDGISKFDALFADIEAANDHIHLMYYIVRDDRLGRKLIETLTRKAREGVKVRFLYDDIGSIRLQRKFFRSFQEAGGEAVAFFPSRIPFFNFKLNFRNHRKLAIIDGKWGYIGGFNVGDEYLGMDERFGEWRDTHLKVTGSAVQMIQTLFLADWNLASGQNIAFEARYFPPPPEQERGTVGMQIVSSGPDSEWQQIKDSYIKMIYAAKKRVCLQTPYFVPDEALLTALRTAAMSGVEVEVMIPSKRDHFFVYWASRSYVGDLLASGARCFLYDQGFLHAKMIVVDGKIASVGTANIDIRSFKLNFEVNAFIYDTETASRLERIFNSDKRGCREWTAQEYLQRPLLSRLKESVSRLLSPIL
ncbi:cardiolipin synthase [Paenibacillus cisolokensis]|uniref:cardiolipin synthase n=1 Tax=Paenibacillus cisolokensis TaxID=1658519 RepID=UPI003D2E36D1